MRCFVGVSSSSFLVVRNPLAETSCIGLLRGQFLFVFEGNWRGDWCFFWLFVSFFLSPEDVHIFGDVENKNKLDSESPCTSPNSEHPFFARL